MSLPLLTRSKMTETMHFYAGSPLNRLSWLRSSSKFLNMAIQMPETRWTVFQAGRPLVARPTDDGARAKFALLETEHVKHFLGEEPFFGQGQGPDEAVSSQASVLETCRLRGATVVFLGEKEPDGTRALPSSDFKTPERPEDIRGAPFFAIDLGQVSQTEIDDFLKSITRTGETFAFEVEPRTATASFSMFEAAVLAESRSLLDWNTRNKFCPACGSPNYSLWGGWKLSCSSLLPQNNKEGKQPCPSSKGLHNFAHPRTDPVVIMAVIDETGDRILLGRSNKFPPGLYSTLAGFCEPAESFEDTVKREIWEECGVRVHDVYYHSSQPWPYPANLMVGYYAFADSSQNIRTDLDNELTDARWFTRDEVKLVLEQAKGATARRAEHLRFDDNASEQTPAPKDMPALRFPPLSAVGGVLISDWATGKSGTRGAVAVKGNL